MPEAMKQKKSAPGPPPVAPNVQPNKDGIEETNVGSKMLEKMVSNLFSSSSRIALMLWRRAGLAVADWVLRGLELSLRSLRAVSSKELDSVLLKVMLLVLSVLVTRSRCSSRRGIAWRRSRRNLDSIFLSIHFAHHARINDER